MVGSKDTPNQSDAGFLPRLRCTFTSGRWNIQTRVAASFEDGLDTGGAAGDRGPWRQQAILGRGVECRRAIVREYALETLGDEDALLVIDETGFLKQGKASCGVARQYTGSEGKVTHCKIGVVASRRRGTAIPSSTERYTCQRSGRTNALA